MWSGKVGHPSEISHSKFKARERGWGRTVFCAEGRVCAKALEARKE
jgi:hypothetical protein